MSDTRPFAVHTSIVNQCSLERAMESAIVSFRPWANPDIDLDIRVRYWHGGHTRRITVDVPGADHSTEEPPV